MNDDRHHKPAYQFRLEDPEIFTGSTGFIKAKFPTKIPLPQHKALLLLQDIPAYHIADANPDALIDADLIRLAFVYNNTTLDEKDKLYEQALLRIEQAYPNNPATAQAGFLREVSTCQRTGTIRFKTGLPVRNQRAKELFEAIYSKFPNPREASTPEYDHADQTEAHRNGKRNVPMHAALPVPGEIQKRPENLFAVLRSSRDEIKEREQRLDYEKF